MADLRFAPGEQELEAALLDLGRRLAYPPTPQLALAVRRRLAEEATRPRRGWPWLARAGRRGWPWAWVPRPDRCLAVALAAVLVLAAAVLAISPGARSAVAGRLGLRGVQITEVPAVPSLPRATPLNLGEPLTLDEVRARVAYPVAVPAALGPPDEVYLSNTPVGGQVALVYYPRPDLPQASTTGLGALLTEFTGEVHDLVAFGKGLPPGTRVQEVQINGERGFWIDGDPHTFFYFDARGQVQTESTRLAANVLLWEHGPLTLRLESALPRDAAVSLATSVR
jgi:hypothetical protein